MKYTPEQITELLEEVQTAREAATPGPWRIFEGKIFGTATTAIDPLVYEFDIGSYCDAGNAHLIVTAPTWLQQLTEIVQQQTVELSEAWKEYDNLKAEMEAQGVELEEWRERCRQVNLQLEEQDAESERLKHSLAIAVEALGHIEHGVLGVEDYCAIATESLERIKASQEGGNTIA